VERAPGDRRVLRGPGLAGVVRADDDGVAAHGPAVAGGDELDAEERRLDRRLLLLPGAPAGGRHGDDAGPPAGPPVAGRPVGDRGDVHVAGVDAGVDRRLRELHLERDLLLRPRLAAVLGVDHRAEVAGAVAALRVRELEREDVPLAAGLDLGPGLPAVGG